ncbi:hypothetical protein EYF80_041552 [Liparis tanakae]|uniref:Uncharacterized protein n=1 Tax=Liparis tanakae TaxID=230148 RepID=A0A4Z2G3X9_9TELE|nr:hypothetical protein EYF80_041552 [Liparis tanakae]
MTYSSAPADSSCITQAEFTRQSISTPDRRGTQGTGVLSVLLLCVGLSLPTHPSLDGVTVTLYSAPHSSASRRQPAFVLLQLCRRPAASVADTVYTTPATPSFQVTDATPVVQLTVGRKVGRGQGAERKRRRGGRINTSNVDLVLLSTEQTRHLAGGTVGVTRPLAATCVRGHRHVGGGALRGLP